MVVFFPRFQCLRRQFLNEKRHNIFVIMLQIVKKKSAFLLQNPPSIPWSRSYLLPDAG